HRGGGYRADGGREVRLRPQRRQPGPQALGLGAQGAAGEAFELVRARVCDASQGGNVTGKRKTGSIGQPARRTERIRTANPAGSSANPVCPPGNIVGSMPRATQSARDVRSQTWPAESSPMPTATPVPAARSAAISGTKQVVGRSTRVFW